MAFTVFSNCLNGRDKKTGMRGAQRQERGQQNKAKDARSGT